MNTILIIIIKMNIKQKIISELKNTEIPNLSFLFSEEVLNIAEELLSEFLEEEKQNFKNKLETDNSKINFDLFEEESKMGYFWSLLNHLKSVNSGDKIREITENIEPKLAEFGNEVSYSKRFFEMFEYCLNNCELDEEQTKIIYETVKNYKIKGINLSLEKQEELKQISLELSKLTTSFSNNVLDSEKEFEYFLETDEFLKEFPESDLENAKNLYVDKMKEKKSTEGFSPLGYAFDSSSSSYVAILKYCSNSEIRKHFAESHSSFASNGKYDNRENVLKIINLKDKKAKLLGYKNYADLSLEFKMAESPEQVIDLLSDLSQKAKPKAMAEIEEIKEFFNLSELNSWDMGYYARILKEKKYKLDDKKLKQYFEFENTKKALFETVEKLYGIRMEKVSRDVAMLHLYSDDIEYYKVYKDQKFISYFIGDYFYNPDKRSGAWADELRNRFGEKKSIVVNVMSLVKSKTGKTLMTLGEVTTLFHEFGHAIHSMLSKSQYAELSGFGVEWDFVELPSQILEKWAEDDLTISNVAKHYETGEKLPLELLESLKNLKYFGTGNFVLGQSSYGVIDMMFYSGEKFDSVEDLDKKYLEKINSLSIFKKEESYKQYASFSHIFAGGYSAGYYSYIWADIIVDEIWAEFKKHGVYNKEIATKFEEKILGAGSIKDAKDMFEDFMGRGVKIDAFLEEKGLK
ncbi:MAG: M3 family metallopeptidase [Candidatus Gracilibacteria bacterium]|nr:M3 family metallopeptidase [Candidatus Gracilibacteria bacterium]